MTGAGDSATTWLVTGGAGYIGAHVVRALLAADFGVAVLDDLSTGREEFVPGGVALTRASVLDTPAVEAALREHAVDGVIHCAGFKYAGESVRRPLHTWRQNLSGTESLLRAMESVGVRRIVFSGSAAVYGTPSEELVTEATPTAPESPYGESKLAAELLIRGQVLATALTDAPLAGTSLRYFNVAGSADPAVWDVSPWHFGNDGAGFPSTADDLRKAMTRNPYLKIWVTCSYYDLATPYFAAESVVAGMNLEPAIRANLRFSYYEAGHMLYIHQPSRVKFKADFESFLHDATHQEPVHTAAR